MLQLVEPAFVNSLYHLAINTKKNYISRIKGFKNWCYKNRRQETQHSAIDYAMTYESNYSKNQVLSALKRYLKFKNRPIKDIKPLRLVEKPKPHLDEEQFKKLINTELPRGFHLRDNIMLRILGNGGLRVSELVGLRLEDVDLVNKSLRIHGSHVKRNKARITYLDQDTITLIKWYVSKGSFSKFDLLFPVSHRRIREILKIYLEAAELPVDISPHRLRDTFAIRFINRGGDITKLSRLLGHSNISTTMGYLRYNDKELQAEYRKVLG